MKKLIIAGGTGYLGKVLCQYFAHKYEIVVLSREELVSFQSTHHLRFVHWDGKSLGDWATELEGAEALINLAGKSVNCRYTEANKQAIFDSRKTSTQILGEAIRLAKNPPKVWINSSTATIYRHAEDRNMDENTGEIGEGFSVEVAKLWEKTFYESLVPNVRKVAIRTAIVLGKTEGVMLRLMNLVRFGLGGKQGDGSQFVSWIHEQDFALSIEYLIDNELLMGTFNVVAPNPVTNNFMMKTLCNIMQKPIALPAYTWMLHIGAMLIGTEPELILKSRRVVPKRLLENGFSFQYDTIEKAFAEIVEKKNYVMPNTPITASIFAFIFGIGEKILSFLNSSPKRRSIFG